MERSGVKAARGLRDFSLSLLDGLPRRKHQSGPMARTGQAHLALRSDGTDYGCNVFLLDNYHNNDGLSQYPCFRHVPITVFAEPSNLSEVYLVGDSLGEWDVPNLVPVSSIVDVNVRGPAMRHGSKWNVLFYDLHVGEGGENGSIQPNPYVPGPPWYCQKTVNYLDGGF